MGQIYRITTLYPTPQILNSPPSSKLLGPTQLPSLIVHEPDHHAIFVNLRCIHFNPNNQTHSYIFFLGWNPNNILPKFNKQHYHSDNVFLAALSQFECCHSQLVSCQSVAHWVTTSIRSPKGFSEIGRKKSLKENGLVSNPCW